MLGQRSERVETPCGPLQIENFDLGTHQADHALGPRAIGHGTSKLNWPLCLTTIDCHWL